MTDSSMADSSAAESRATDRGMDPRKELLIAVLGPALVCLAIFLLVRACGVRPTPFRMVPETGEALTLPGTVTPVDEKLARALETTRVPDTVADLTDSDPTREDLAEILAAALPPHDGSSLDAKISLHLYVVFRGSTYFYESIDQELLSLTTLRPVAASQQDEAAVADDADGAAGEDDKSDDDTAWIRERIDLQEKGFPAPVVLVFCTPPGLPRSAQGPISFAPSPLQWVASGEARYRAELVARARGLVAVPRIECQRRALAGDLGLKEDQSILTLLILSGR